ncbi:MAG: hypothetical protein ACFCU8_21030 [Thermosynechococcaceae cyanobacterium]
MKTFWFFRRIRRYDPDCIIVRPEEVCDRFAETLTLMYQSYAW